MLNLFLVQAQETQAQPTGSVWGGLIPLILIFVIFYFLLIRPQQKRTKEHQKLLESLKKGDRVLTSGGLYGTIYSLRGKDVELEISEGVIVTLAKSSVVSVISSAESAEEKK